MDRIGQKDSYAPANARREIDRHDTLALNLHGLPIDPWLADRADSPRSNDLDRWFATATKETEGSWTELIKVESMTTRVAVVGIGLLLLLTLIGLAVVCWEGIGWVWESILMTN
ncbi:MAG: hypothetical protein JO308_05030 [Verrucomicrobia bacterium]|nr:hypothetical protein [Verrucomicrobiota bacterium]